MCTYQVVVALGSLARMMGRQAGVKIVYHGGNSTLQIKCSSELHFIAICCSFCNLNLPYLSSKIEKKTT